MPRVLTAVVLAALLCAAPLWPREDKPGGKPAAPGEKIDAKAARSLTGFLDKVDAKDEQNGTKTLLRTSGGKYTLQIDKKTKILRASGDPLEAGLKSPVLPGAEVKVVFVDRDAKEAKSEKSEVHACQVIQLIKKELRKDK